MSAPLFSVILGARVRYLPCLFFTCPAYLPVEVVVALRIVFQTPLTLRWILTGTADLQAANPSPTDTWPATWRVSLRRSVTLLPCLVITVTVKLVVLVAEPQPVVTLIGPVVAVEGTVAFIWVAEGTVNVAVTLLNVTEVVVKPVPLKFVPVIVTDVPVGPEVGVNEVIVGAPAPPPVTVKLLVLVLCPAVV
jgi:hypothetical protein